MNQRQINMYTELDYQQIELRVFANLGKRSLGIRGSGTSYSVGIAGKISIVKEVVYVRKRIKSNSSL